MAENEQINWVKEKKGYMTNGNTLGPWQEAGVDDGVINDILKRKYLNADFNFILFLLLCFITSIGYLFITLWKDNLLINTIFALILACVFSTLLYTNIKEYKVKRDNVINRQYRVCDIIAFDFSERSQEKLCCVKDLQGNVLLEKNGAQEPTPKKIIYYSTLDEKNPTGKLLVVEYGKDHFMYLVFPEKYLKAD